MSTPLIGGDTMKRKLAITGAAALAFALAGGTAHAQSAGSFYVSTGWFHLSPQDSRDVSGISCAEVG
ncbi:hypothetical protein C6Q07_07665 [Burkholderia multivorans]|nr:hypothetical protein C6Q07_07665 [Burkholderia multivorans]